MTSKLDLGGREQELWQTVLRTLMYGSADIKGTRIHLSLQQVGYGRTKISMSMAYEYIGSIVLMGETHSGVDLSRVMIKLSKERSEGRKIIEHLIRECPYFNSKRNPREGTYKIVGYEDNEVMSRSIGRTMKRSINGELLLPVPYISMLANRHQQCDEPDYYDSEESDYDE